jgi:hypothetical protein
MPNYYTSPLAASFADASQVAATTTESLLHPVFSFGAGDNRVFQGAYFRLTDHFDISNVVTTPGTVRFRIRSGTAGSGLTGTVLADTGTIAMDTTARANFSGRLEALLAFRSVGSAGQVFAMGVVLLGNVPAGAAADPQGIYHMGSAGENVPAAVGSIDTTVARDLAVTVQFSVATAGTQITNHLSLLEAVHT